MKQYSLSEMEDRYIGKIGTPERDEYEYELRMELLSRMIKSTRKERGLTQEALGELVGVNKSQISNDLITYIPTKAQRTQIFLSELCAFVGNVYGLFIFHS